MTFGPLVTVDDVAAMLGDPSLRIIDCRWYLTDPPGGRRAYEAGHLPGARYLALEHDLSAPTGPGRHPLPDPQEWASRMARIGIGDDTTVVAYDDRGGAVAARLWWMLRAVGHERVAVLDGGIDAWTTAGHGLTSDVPVWPETELTAPSHWPGTIGRDDLASRLGSVVLVDARSEPRYRGEEEPIDPVAGHIPTAVSLPYEDNLRDGWMLPPDDLRRRYESAGSKPGADVVVYCGSGVTACHDLLSLEVAGLGPGILYPGSWSDWGGSGGPVATGPEPGDAPAGGG